MTAMFLSKVEREYLIRDPLNVIRPRARFIGNGTKRVKRVWFVPASGHFVADCSTWLRKRWFYSYDDGVTWRRLRDRPATMLVDRDGRIYPPVTTVVLRGKK